MSQNLSRYEDPWTAEIYDHQVAASWADRDIAFYINLAKESPGPVLELACGTGRVMIALAREGVHVTGLDISPNMLNVARRKIDRECPHVRRRITVVQGDMASFSLEEKFGLILIPYRSFQALLEPSDQKGCLEACARHLLPEGRLVINVFQPRPSRLEMPGPVEEQPRDFPGPYGLRIRQTACTEFDAPNQRLRSRIKYESTSQGGDVALREHSLELCYFFRSDMERLLEDCGFEVEAAYGNFDRSPLSADSPEMIFVARKAVKK